MCLMEKKLKELREYNEIKQMQKGLNKIANRSHIMNEKDFKHAIGLYPSKF